MKPRATLRLVLIIGFTILGVSPANAQGVAQTATKDQLEAFLLDETNQQRGAIEIVQAIAQTNAELEAGKRAQVRGGDSFRGDGLPKTFGDRESKTAFIKERERRLETFQIGRAHV